MIYLDNNSTTAPLPEVIEHFCKIASAPLNASSVHQQGRLASSYIMEAQNAIKNALNANDYEVIFTSSGTEANNLAIRGLKGREDIIISGKEHDSIYNISSILNAKTIKLQPNGLVDKDHFQEILRDAKKPLLSIMHACNETGVIEESLADIRNEVVSQGGFFHTDLTQSFGKIAIDLGKTNADMATISAHKIGGIAGVAALIYKKGLEFEAQIIGGGQQKALRAGTEAVALISSFGKAAQMINLSASGNIQVLRDYFEEQLIKKFGSNAVILSQEAPRLPNTSMFAIKNMPSEIMLIKLDLEGICLSNGSACSSGKVEPSRTLLNMGVSEELAKCSLRVSLSKNNTKKEIDRLVEVL